MADTFRQDENCLSIFIYKANKQGPISSLTLPNDIREALELKTVTKVAIDTDIVYDEGDTRPIKKEMMLTVEAIVNQTSVTVLSNFYTNNNPSAVKEAVIYPATGVGTTANPRGGNPLNNVNLDTNTLITFIDSFLSTPGSIIDLSNYPGPMRNIVSGVSNEPVSIAHWIRQASSGLLVDSYNGPKPLSVKIETLPGGNDFRLIWKVKYTLSMQDTIDFSGFDEVPQPHVGLSEAALALIDVSSELRLDIDKNGDLEINVSGTLYAPNPNLLYKARAYLNIIVYPLQQTVQTSEVVPYNPTDPDSLTTEEKYRDVFAQVNGFEKTVTFNVERNGRSAKFTVKYTQIKSNSAYPLGIRDIEFDHSLESSLFGDTMQGAGMVSWKNTFSGKIKIPHRFHAAYAWFVLWYLIAERTRKLKRFTKGQDATKAISDLQSKMNEAATGEEDTSRNKISALCTKVKLKHSIYSREFNFDIDYLVLCPLNYVFSATCFFERLNNDYIRRYNMPVDEDTQGLSMEYRPDLLSNQWIKWMKSVDPAYGFDPEQEEGFNPNRKNRQFFDNAGTEIADGGHEINPFKMYQGRNLQQTHAFVTTVIDPNEKDPDYNEPTRGIDDIVGWFGIPNPGKTASGSGSTNRYLSADQDNTNTVTQNPYGPYGSSSDRSLLEMVEDKIDPRFSWIKYEETYHVSETHPTIPVEGLNGADVSWHGEEKLYRQYVSNPIGTDIFENPETVATPMTPGSIPDPSAETGFRLASGMYATAGSSDPENPEFPLTDYSSGHPEIEDPMVRKTYALKGSRYFITVKGHAIRAQYPISIPTVLAIGGAPAIKVGTGKSMITPMGVQGSTPVYVAAWEQTYTVDKTLLNEDILSRLESTGASILYT